MLYSKRITLLAAAISSVSAYADSHKVEEMVVTANRVEQSIDSVLAPVTVINRKKLEAIQASDLYDVLKRVPGVQLNRTGGKGGNSSLLVRGSNSDHVLVLVDGVRFESATLGQASLDAIPVDQIERIEIVRAPRSSLYGSDAIGGVIQIFTRKSADTSSTKISLGYGSENTQEIGIASTLAYGDGAVFLAANYEESDGIDAQYADDEWTGNSEFDADEDGYLARDVSVNWNHQLSEKVSVGWSNFYSQDKSRYDETKSEFSYIAETDSWESSPVASAPYSESQHAKSTIVVDAAISALWAVKAQVGYALDDSITRNEVDAYDDKSQIKTERYNHTISNSLTFNEDHQMVAGVEYLKDFVEGDQAYAEDERENIGTFVQYMANFGDASVSIGGRYDDNEQFGGYETGNVAFGYRVMPELETILSFGTAFKAPTFNDLYWPGLGNENLSPEESKNVELQFRGDINDISSYELNFFQNEIEDLIQWAPNDLGIWQPQNVAEARIQGVELVYGATFDFANVDFNTTYSEPKDLSANEDLRRRSRLVGSVDVSRSGDGYKMGFTVNGVSEKKGAEKLAGYGTLDMRFEKQMTEALTAKIKVDNLFDKDLVQAEKYNDQGRFALIEVEYAFKH